MSETTNGAPATVAVPAELLKTLLVGVTCIALGGGAGTAVWSFADQGDVDEVSTQVRALALKVDELREELRRDRWTRTDQRQWIADEYKPAAAEVEQRLRALEIDRGSR